MDADGYRRCAKTTTCRFWSSIMTEPGNIARVLKGEGSATLVY